MKKRLKTPKARRDYMKAYMQRRRDQKVAAAQAACREAVPLEVRIYHVEDFTGPIPDGMIEMTPAELVKEYEGAPRVCALCGRAMP